MPVWIHRFDRLMRGELTTLPVLRTDGLALPVVGIAVMIDLLGMAYGACMGLFALTGSGNGSAMMIPADMLKVPALFLLTLGVTLPSLYVFSALLGSRLNFSAVARLLLCTLAIMLAVLSSGGPIVAFFSVCTASYLFMVLLNVLVFFIAGLFGLAFLLRTLNRMTLAISMNDEPNLAPTPATRSGGAVFHVWLIVFCLVGAQMGWVLRPFVGQPGVPFAWVRPRQSNFFQAVGGDLQQFFSEDSTTGRR